MPLFSSLLLLAAFELLVQASLLVTRQDYCLGLPFPCTPIIINEVVADSKLNVYEVDDAIPKDPYVRYVQAVVHTVMPEFRTFLGKRPMRLDFYVMSKVLNDDAWAITYSPRAGLCEVQIQIFEDVHTGASMSENDFKMTVAHELYHCVQRSLRPRAGETPSFAKWWREGTAEYFSNHYYPPIQDHSLSHLPFYDPGLPLQRAANDGDTAGLFFQFLENTGWTTNEIHDWMTDQTFSRGPIREMIRISHDMSLTEKFPEFATKLIDNELKYSNGRTIVRDGKLSVISKEFSVPDTSGKAFEWPMRTKRWAVHALAHTNFPTNKRVTFTFKVDDPRDTGTLLQYRKKGGKWRKAKSGESVDLQGTKSSSCPKRSTHYDFLVTSTSDPSKDRIHKKDHESYSKILFTVSTLKKRQETCEEELSTEAALDQCLVGNWALDLDAMRAFMTEKMLALQGATVSDIILTGSASLDINDAYFTKMSFSPLRIANDISAQGRTGSGTIDISDFVNGNIVGGVTPSTFSWAQQGLKSEGTVHSVISIPSLGPDMTYDLNLGEQYGPQITVNYSCSADVLQMTGTFNGIYMWSYVWRRT